LGHLFTPKLRVLKLQKVIERALSCFTGKETYRLFRVQSTLFVFLTSVC
jgi:hypothetical protein